ncbi:MAG: hypothetical protein Q8N08_00495 [Methanobacteriaceae archaeon]|nr:hypothetical protein [Methanobacteriaceae archaeon]
MKALILIWAEGSIFSIGFETGLTDWRPLIKDQGYLVVHDEYKSHQEKLKIISKCEYRLLDCFFISNSVWWSEYYQPLEKQIISLEHHHDPLLQKDLEKEIKMFKDTPGLYSSVFYIMQKF